MAVRTSQGDGSCCSSIECLPEDLLEAVLLRLPFLSLGFAKQVCKTWKRVIDSDTFSHSYKGTAWLVEILKPASSTRGYEITDGNRTFPWGNSTILGGLCTCHLNGLLLAFCRDTLEKFFICNIFLNKRQELPAPNCHSMFSGVFALEGGQHRVASWNWCDDIFTHDIGQPGWSAVGESACLALPPVVLGNSMFCTMANKGVLLEFNAMLSRFSSKRIRTAATSNERLELPPRPKLLVWRNKLYMLLECIGKPLEIWELSPSDARATLVDKFGTGVWEGFTGFQFCRQLNDNGLLHLQGFVPQDKITDGNNTVSLLYNMATKSLVNTSFHNAATIRVGIELPVVLRDQNIF